MDLRENRAWIVEGDTAAVRLVGANGMCWLGPMACALLLVKVFCLSKFGF